MSQKYDVQFGGLHIATLQLQRQLEELKGLAKRRQRQREEFDRVLNQLIPIVGEAEAMKMAEAALTGGMKKAQEQADKGFIPHRKGHGPKDVKVAVTPDVVKKIQTRLAKKA